MAVKANADRATKNDEDSPPDKRTMQCMEIRGGNVAVEEILDVRLDEWIYSRPHESAQSGGDVHYLSLCASGTISRLILADISGHGASVAGFAVRYVAS